jgi:hypothetical protein
VSCAGNDAPAILKALDAPDWDKLDQSRKINWLRAAGLVFTRHGTPTPAARATVLAKIDSGYPAWNETPSSSIAGKTPSPVSSMPPGLINRLNPQQLKGSARLPAKPGFQLNSCNQEEFVLPPGGRFSILPPLIFPPIPTHPSYDRP